MTLISNEEVEGPSFTKIYESLLIILLCHEEPNKPMLKSTVVLCSNGKRFYKLPFLVCSFLSVPPGLLEKA